MVQCKQNCNHFEFLWHQNKNQWLKTRNKTSFSIYFCTNLANDDTFFVNYYLNSGIYLFLFLFCCNQKVGIRILSGASGRREKKILKSKCKERLREKKSEIVE